MILGRVLGREASMNLMGWSSRKPLPRPGAASLARTAVSPTSPVSIPASPVPQPRAYRTLRRWPLQQPVAQPDAQLPGEDLDHVLAVRQSQRRSSAPKTAPLAAAPGGGLHRGIGLRHFHDPGEWPGSGSWACTRERRPRLRYLAQLTSGRASARPSFLRGAAA